MNATRGHYTVWVCEDCTMAENGYDTPQADREPWGQLTDTEIPTMGLLWEEHDDGCANRAAGESLEDCECDRRTFDKSPCGACGSHLAGSRHAYTVWHD